MKRMIRFLTWLRPLGYCVACSIQTSMPTCPNCKGPVG